MQTKRQFKCVMTSFMQWKKLLDPNVLCKKKKRLCVWYTAPTTTMYHNKACIDWPRWMCMLLCEIRLRWCVCVLRPCIRIYYAFINMWFCCQISLNTKTKICVLVLSSLFLFIFVCQWKWKNTPSIDVAATVWHECCTNHYFESSNRRIKSNAKSVAIH